MEDFDVTTLTLGRNDVLHAHFADDCSDADMHTAIVGLADALKQQGITNAVIMSRGPWNLSAIPESEMNAHGWYRREGDA